MRLTTDYLIPHKSFDYQKPIELWHPYLGNVLGLEEALEKYTGCLEADVYLLPPDASPTQPLTGQKNNI